MKIKRINQFLASIAEECDRTSVQADPLFLDILKKSLGKLFGDSRLASGDGVDPPMDADPLVQAIKATEAKAVEQMLPDDDLPAPTSPPPNAEPLLRP